MPHHRLAPVISSTAGFGSFTKATGRLCLAFYLFISLLFAYSANASTPINTLITNQATATYHFQGKEFSEKNEVSFLTNKDPNAQQSPSNGIAPEIEFIRYQASGVIALGALSPTTPVTISGNQKQRASANAPSNTLNVESTYCSSADDLNIQPTPTPFDLSGNLLAIPGSYNFSFDNRYKAGEPVFVRVTDLDRNQDPVKQENLVIDIASDSGGFIDQERLILTETGVNSGEFIGYLQSVQANSATFYDCMLSVKTNTPLTAVYQDAQDITRRKNAAAAIDPYSKIFNTETGDLINDFEITLIDVATGLPALVYGDDGVSLFPPTIQSGGTATDASGNNYSFPDGSYRFPFIPVGNYQLTFTNGLNWRTPSNLSDTDLLQVGNFTLDTGSRGESFQVTANSLHLDIPVDPIHSETLLTKTANKDSASMGDFVKYSIQINNGDLAGDDVLLVDHLPLGLAYIPGSAKLDSTPVTVETSNTGRQLSINIGSVDIRENKTLSYVTKVITNAPLGTARNIAQIQHPHLYSNQTQADVEITEAFFTNQVRLFGRVHTGTCDGELNDEGIEGIQLYLEDGTSVKTDEDGLWHMENIKPGSHVVQLDTTTLPAYFELIQCDTQGLHSGQSYSQFVDVQPGGYWRVDFLLKLKPPLDGQVLQQLSSQLIENNTNDGLDEKIRYQLDVSGEAVEVRKVRQVIILPAGVSYEAGSSFINGQKVKDPKVDGQSIIYSLGNPDINWRKFIQFNAIIGPSAESGELTARSMTVFDTPSKSSLYTPAAETSALLYMPPKPDEPDAQTAPPTFASFSHDIDLIEQLDLDEQLADLHKLKNVKIEIIGHTDNQRIRQRSRHIYKNNLELSLGRARQAANYLIQELNLRPDQITISGQGSSQPIAQNSNQTNRAKNRRVEVRLISADAQVVMEKQQSDLQFVSTQGLLPGIPWDLPATAAGPGLGSYDIELDMPVFDDNWFKHQSTQNTWLWPKPDYSPLVPATKVAIKTLKSHKVELSLNGIPVSALNREGSIAGNGSELKVNKWRGIPLDEGENTFVAIISNKHGKEIERLTQSISFGGLPVSAEILESKSINLANGKDSPIIAVKFLDKNNQPVRRGYRGKFILAAPYQSQDEADSYNSNALNSDQDLYYSVEEQGIAYIHLKPTIQSGEAKLSFEHPDGEQDQLNFWLKPQARDWVLVALAEGTLGYQSLSGNIDGAKANGLQENLYSDGRLAFFAKGRIKGEWLLTASYDSAKEKSTPFSRLIDPDRYYLLYADNSEQQMEASSAHKLYLRIEKDRFYSVYGDIRTELNHTELGRYERTLTGVKSVYNGKVFNLNLFASQTDKAFVREEIQGDGTSGLYHLKAKDIVNNTETIYLETRDRLRSEEIIQRRLLSRTSDYVIDYHSGSLFFKFPIHSTDENFNPQFITASYETNSQQEQDWVVGGRGALKLLNNTLEVGISAIQDESPGNEKSLQAVDTTLELPFDVKMKMELAQSKNTSAGQTNQGNAVLASIEQRTEGHSGKVYYRRQEKDFGLEQQNLGESDKEKMGVQSTLYVSDELRIKSQIIHQQNISTDNHQTLIESQAELKKGQTSYQAGARINQRNNAGASESSSQLLLGARYQVNSALNLHAKSEINLNQDAYTLNNLQLGADYRINTAVSLYARHELTWDKENTQRTTLGLKSSPWQGAQLHQALEQQQYKDSQRLQAVHGLSQDWQISQHWRLSASYNAANNIEDSALEDNRVALNTDDFYAISTGAAFHTSWLQFNSKAEYRDASDSEKWSLNSAIYQPNYSGLSLGGSFSAYHEEESTFDNSYQNLEVDLAWHPANSSWALLSRTNLINEDINNETENFTNQRLIENLHLNNKWRNLQWYGQFGLKYVQEQIDAKDFQSLITYLGGELGYLINNQWDVSLHSRRLQDIKDSNASYSSGISAGWRPVKNTWISLGYNFNGFTDEDFSAAAYSAQGIYLKLRIKADQDSLADLKQAFNY